MSDSPIVRAVQQVMEAVNTRLAKQDATIAEQNSEIRSLREQLQTRAATPEFVIPAPIPGKDGVNGRGVESATISEGMLTLRYTDGNEQIVGRVMGEPGAPGKDGKDGVDGIAKDGKDGRDGKDGERGADGVATREEIVAIATAAVEERAAEVNTRTFADFYQGVFKENTTYARGLAATWDGSLWLSTRETSDKPGTDKSGWKLIVKKGRDGR